MLKNESCLWDKKYSAARNYQTREDVFLFSENNPTLVAIKSFINSEMSVLEVGSGTGELISYLKSKFNIKAFGLDFSEESIKRSKEMSNKFDLGVDFQRGDISKMPYDDESFDIVYGDQVLGHIENLDDALKEIFRITKKGGIVAFSIGNALRPDGWRLNTFLSKSHPGYQQKNMFPWDLSSKLKLFGFKHLNYYGDMLLLFRNISLVRSLFIKKTSAQSNKTASPSFSRKSLLKRIYYFFDNIFPGWVKVTVGVVAKK